MSERIISDDWINQINPHSRPISKRFQQQPTYNNGCSGMWNLTQEPIDWNLNYIDFEREIKRLQEMFKSPFVSSTKIMEEEIIKIGFNDEKDPLKDKCFTNDDENERDDN